jgi:ketosteroid isomerase-like protein
MASPAADDRVDVVRRALSAFAARDLGAMGPDMAEDVIWVTPGRSPIAGAFGRPGRRPYREGPRGHRVEVSGERHGRSLWQRAVQLFRIRDGLIAERRIFPPDQAAWDESWSA